jgi:putative inorganic carbon (HCO3(-)) transporter
MIIFYFLILVLPLTQHHLWAQFVGDITGIKYIGFACLPYAVLRLVGRRQAPSFFETWQGRLFVALCLLSTLSYLTMGTGKWYVSHWLTYVSLLILFFITLVLVDTLDRLRWVLLTASASLAVASLYVLRDWQTYHNMYKDYRPGWVVGDPNYFTVNVLLFLPTTFLMIQKSTRRWERWFCLGCFVITLFGVMVSASRGGFLGILAGSLYLILRNKRRIRNVALIGISLAMVVLASPVSPLQRFRNPSQGDKQSADTHIALMYGGIRMMLAHPLFGVGIDNFKRNSRFFVTAGEAAQMDNQSRVAHNSYVEIGAEMGIPGLLLFAGMLFSSFTSLGKVARMSERWGVPLIQEAAVGLQAGLVGSSVAIFFVSGEYQKMFWLALFLTMCLPPLALEAAKRQRKRRHLMDVPQSYKPLGRLETVAVSPLRSSQITDNQATL